MKQLTLIIGVFLLLTFFIQSVNAETYAQNSEINLKVSCSKVNCSNPQNITIFYPNSSIIINNKEMTLSNGFFNFTFNNTSPLGEYSFVLSPEGYESAFLVTPSGYEPTTAQGLIYALLILASMFFLIVCLYGAFSIDGNNDFTMGGDLIKVNFNKYYKGFLFLIAYLFAIFTSYLTWQVSTQFLLLDLGTAVFKTIFTFLWYMFFPIMILLIIVGFMKWLADVELHKLAERHLKQR